jgi:hypothetical protein
MKAEFSEFSYGFALSFEIMSAIKGIAGVPLFPSLPKEGEMGHDVSFEPAGWPVFLQFKLADWMKGPNAKYRSEYGSPYFRVTVYVYERTHSNQHNLLRALSQDEPEVYYAVPQFYRQGEFNALFAENRIFIESAFIPLSELPDLTDDDQHYITYLPGSSGFRWHSGGGKDFRIDVSGSYWAEHLCELVTKPRELGERYFVGLRERLVRLIREHTLQPDLFELPVNLNDVSPLAVIRDLRYLLVTYFGVEPMILYPR